MSDRPYIHGYDPREQARLIAQAEHWREMILDGLSLQPGQKLLEVGCGAGAVLGVIGSANPETHLSGIDIEPKQIEKARAHLSSLGQSADLRVGDAATLPWADRTFDHAYFIWMLEHLPEPSAVLKETLRVLKPGGRVTITETDYNFVVYPEHDDFTILMHAWREEFKKHGDPLLARRLGPTLLRCGYSMVRNRIWGFHVFRAPGSDALHRMCNYHADYIKPELPRIARGQHLEQSRLANGVNWLRQLADQPDASITGTVYRATGVRG